MKRLVVDSAVDGFEFVLLPDLLVKAYFFALDLVRKFSLFFLELLGVAELVGREDFFPDQEFADFTCASTARTRRVSKYARCAPGTSAKKTGSS